MRDLDREWLVALYGAMRGPCAPAVLAFSWLGSGWLGLLLVPLWSCRRTRVGAAHLSVAVVLQAAAVWILKRAVGRVRPWIALGLGVFPWAPIDPSFPSGHASAAFCVATFAFVVTGLCRRRFAARAAASFALGLAVLVAVSRVCLAVHYPSDVIAGALLGGAIGSLAGGRFVQRAARADSGREPPTVEAP